VTLTVQNFVQAANSTWIDNRDISISKDGQTAKRGNFIFSEGAKKNDAAMQAFRDALSKEYGVFGRNAFDMLLGGRAQMHKSLRACDIKATISILDKVKNNQLIAETKRQLEIDPKMLELSDPLRVKVRTYLTGHLMDGVKLADLKDMSDLKMVASKAIGKAIDMTIELAKQENAASRAMKQDQKWDLTPQKIGGKYEGDIVVEGTTPTGLRNLENNFGTKATSVADHLARGLVGEGMRVNYGNDNPVLFEKLKDNGVEPGFICKQDWSAKDTSSLFTDFDTLQSRDQLENLKYIYPGVAEKCEGKPLREQIMLFGRAHPAGIAAVADYMLEKAMLDPNSAICKAFVEKFPGVDPANWREAGVDNVKKQLFTEIREAVSNVKQNDPDYDKSPIFKHFSDRHIVKLDYNEKDRIICKKAGSAGKFMRPERIVNGRRFGQIYRLQTAKTADDISSDAVTEALANDLTRIAGVPSQELQIVRGQYSDGHPKLMLQARFGSGYQDMEKGFLKDGQLQQKGDVKPEKIGKYKAFFIVTADRDGVGSRGQNKGFTTDGKFFAIDPGHSLEGNSRYLELDDNFQFKDTYGSSTKPRFKNFSVFDDDTRFAKFQGALELRELKMSGKIDGLFNSYRGAFRTDEPGISPEEKALRGKILEKIAAKEQEFRDSMQKLLNVAQGQFELYDSLAPRGAQYQEKAIETIENLEKLTSPTTWVSPKGDVALDHLHVKPETRMPWAAYVEGDNLVYHCDKPLSAEAQQSLMLLAQNSGAQVEISADGCARITVALDQAEGVFARFSEEKVCQVTHPEEYNARNTAGGDPLAAARNAQAKPVAPAAPVDAPPPLDLPEELELQVGDQTYRIPRGHIAPMIESTPEADRPRGLDELRQILSARIGRGQDILRAVYAGKSGRYQASNENVACVTLALHAGTFAKGEINTRGAFSVEDPDGRLYRWLDTNKELYLRTSTHARVYHDRQVDGHMNMPRGLDIAQGVKNGMFGPMRTMQFFTLPGVAGQARRLYIKCETYGVFRNTISKENEEKSRSLGMQTRQARDGDTVESAKHMLSLLSVVTRKGNDPGNRKEDLPKPIEAAMEKARKEFSKLPAGPSFMRMLEQKVGGQANGGIRMLLENISNMTRFNAHLFDGGTEIFLMPSHKKVLNDLLNAISDYTLGYTGERDSRIGREVMLNCNEIVPGWQNGAQNA
jgi:hypothetical protein